MVGLNQKKKDIFKRVLGKHVAEDVFVELKNLN